MSKEELLHLSKLHTYFALKLSENEASNAIRNSLLVKIHQNSEDDSPFKKKTFCSYCFAYWKEGNYSVKIKSKTKSKKNLSKAVEKKMIMKCLRCLNISTTIFTSPQNSQSIVKKIHKKQNHLFREATNTSTSDSANIAVKITKKNKKGKLKTQNTVKKKCNLNTLVKVKKKSSLTFVNDFL